MGYHRGEEVQAHGASVVAVRLSRNIPVFKVAVEGSLERRGEGGIPEPVEGRRERGEGGMLSHLPLSAL